ncbi:hypothetical protein KAMAJI_00280 [Serratia phage vB_SmaM-Kamaji]|nr:hypothetical protein KAMAJI_00280 [Serratia phage vB_SmaM-Kamaji]
MSIKSVVKRLYTVLSQVAHEIFTMGPPKSFSVQTSLTGESLLEFHDYGFMQGSALKRTDVGLNGCLINAHIDMFFPKSIELAKQVLRGEKDYCLQAADKQYIVARIEKHLAGGKVRGMGRVTSGNLGVVSHDLSPADRAELTHLVEMYHAHNGNTAGV